MIYTTSDLYFAATLRALRIKFNGITNDIGKKYFIFEVEDMEEIDNLKNKYYIREVNVDAKSLIDAIKELKARIYADR